MAAALHAIAVCCMFFFLPLVLVVVVVKSEVLAGPWDASWARHKQPLTSIETVPVVSAFLLCHCVCVCVRGACV